MNYSNLGDLAMVFLLLCIVCTLAWNLITFGIEVYQDVQRDKEDIRKVEDMML